jgi:hypothetical protein
MLLTARDEYINCDKLIKEANVLYEIVKNVDGLSNDDIYYFQNANKYINTYKEFRECLIIQYIEDLIKYIE